MHLLVNGSPAGMANFDPLPLPPHLLETLDAATHVADVVTALALTPLLAFAQARGRVVQTGPEMALAQMKLMGQFIGAIPVNRGRGMKSWDVIVIGAGAGGFAAAVTACCNGLSVLMLEKRRSLAAPRRFPAERYGSTIPIRRVRREKRRGGRDQNLPENDHR